MPSKPPSARMTICARCGHPDHWHRHDDGACLSTHPQPCAPAGCGPGPIHGAPFRCLGYDVDGSGYPGGTPESRCGCQDYVRPENPPHGPVSERFMRHHYGAKR